MLPRQPQSLLGVAERTGLPQRLRNLLRVRRCLPGVCPRLWEDEGHDLHAVGSSPGAGKRLFATPTSQKVEQTVTVLRHCLLGCCILAVAQISSVSTGGTKSVRSPTSSDWPLASVRLADHHFILPLPKLIRACRVEQDQKEASKKQGLRGSSVSISVQELSRLSIDAPRNTLLG